LRSKRIARLDEDPDGIATSGPADSIIDTLVDSDTAARWREEMDLVEGACGQFDLESFQHGTLTPVYFGSALKNFGVRNLLDALVAHAPSPRAEQATTRMGVATGPRQSGAIFKIQANMDRNPRERIADRRVCSGKLTRNMRVKIERTGNTMALTSPQCVSAQ